MQQGPEGQEAARAGQASHQQGQGSQQGVRVMGITWDKQNKK